VGAITMDSKMLAGGRLRGSGHAVADWCTSRAVLASTRRRSARRPGERVARVNQAVPHTLLSILTYRQPVAMTKWW